VWDVRPKTTPTRSSSRFRAIADGMSSLMDRMRLEADIRNGWLAFQTIDDGPEIRRRLAPIPDDWTEVSEAELARWCVEASPTKVRRP